MARGPEAKIQDAVIKYARSKGLLCKKNEVGRYMVASGWPDYMVFGVSTIRDVYHGREVLALPKVVFMEFKRPGGKLTPLQQDVYDKLRAKGFTYYMVDDAAEGKALIDKEFA